MWYRLQAILLTLTIAASVAACSAPAAPSPTPAGASSFEEYGAAFCSAWGPLFRVVGNPDTAGWTDAVHELQAAAETRDAVTAARLQGEINAELETARGQIAYAAGWPPAARPMAELDRFFVAQEIWISAYAEIAKGIPNAPDPQEAFEAAGGLDAWRALFEAYADVEPYRPASVGQCPGAPISP